MGGYKACVFYDSEPLAFNKAANNGSIWYNERKAYEIGLNQEECYACIAHELGHMMDDLNRGNVENQQDREKYADCITRDLGLGDSMISALKKMIEYYQQHTDGEENNINIANLQARIDALASSEAL